VPTIIVQLLGLRGDPMLTESYVRCFDGIRLTDIPEVGGKNASLGELHAMLAAEGGRIPDGFALIADAYREARTAAGAWGELRHLLADLDHHNVVLLAETMPQSTLTTKRRISSATSSL